MLSGECEGSSSDQDSTDAREEHIRAITVSREAEFTSQAAKPQDQMMRPGVGDMIYKQGSQQD